MDQTLYSVLDPGKGAKWCDLSDGSSDQLADLIALLHGGPWIDLGTLDGESDLLLLFVHRQNLDLDLLTDLENFARVVDSAPGELTDVDQSIGSTQIHEGAKVGEVADHTFANLTHL